MPDGDKIPFDYLGAKKEGYSDQEIMGFLKDKYSFDFDLVGAKKSGYSDKEIADYITAYEPPKKKEPSLLLPSSKDYAGASTLFTLNGKKTTEEEGGKWVKTAPIEQSGISALPTDIKRTSNINYDPYKFNQNEIFDKAANYVKEINPADKDPLKTILDKPDRSMTGNLAKGAAINYALQNVIPDGFEAKKLLANTDITKDTGNETNKQLAAYATKAANEYDEIADKMKNVGGLYTKQTFYQQAIKQYAKENPVFAKELKAKGLDLNDTFIADKINSYKVGQAVENFLNDKNVATYVNKENPLLLPEIQNIQDNLLTDLPQYGINKVANKVSQARIREMQTNPLFDWTESDKDYQMTNQIASNVLSPQEKQIYDTYIKDKQGDYLDKPSMVSGIAIGIKDTFKGIGEWANIFNSKGEVINQKWEDEARNVSANAPGLLGVLNDAGKTLGLVLTMGATGEATGLGAVPNTVATFGAESLKHNREKYPDSPVKAFTGAALETTMYAALAKNIFQSKNVQQAFNKVQPEISKIAESLTNGTIEKEAASQALQTNFKKAIDFIKGTVGKSAAITGELEGINIVRRGFDKLAMDEETFKQYHPAEEIDPLHTFLTNLAVGGLGKYGESKAKEKEFSETLYNAASNPKLAERLINETVTTEKEEQELKSNLNHIATVKNNLQEKGFSEDAQKHFILQSLREKVAKEKAEKLIDPTLKKEQNDIAKEAGEAKEQILQGKQPDEIVTESQQKIIDQKEKAQTEIERLKFDNDIANKKIDAKIEETDGRESEANRIKLQELKEEKRRVNEDYQKNVAKWQKEIPPEEKSLPEDLLSKEAEKAPEEKIVNDSIEAAKDIPSEAWRNAFLENPKESLRQIAQQVHSSESEKSGAINTFTKKITDLATELYPTKESTLEKQQPSETETIQATPEVPEQIPPIEKTPAEEPTIEAGKGAEPPKGEVEQAAVAGGDVELTKIANAVNDELIKGKFGVDALDGIISKLQDTDLANTYTAIKEKVQKGTLDPKLTRDKVMTQKSGNATDQAVLLYDMAQLKGQEKELRRQIIEATDEREKTILQGQLVDVQNSMMDNALANRYIGRDWHNIGTIRQQWINKDYNIVDMQNEYMASKGISELSPEQKAEVQKFHDTIKDLEAQRDKAKEELDKAIAENEKLKAEKELLEKLKGKAPRVKRTEEQIAKSNERIKKAKDELRGLRGELSDVTRVLPKTAAIIGKIAAEKVYQGVIQFRELVRDILHDVKDIFPEWTEKDVAAHLLHETKGFEKYYEAGKKYDTSNKELQEKIRAYNEMNKQYALKLFEWQKDRRSDIMAKKPFKEKVLDGMLRWQRFAVLTYPTTLLKLAGVVAHQLAFKPIKFAIQKTIAAGASKLLGISSKQQLWGNPTWRSIGKYYSEFVRNFSLANLKEQFSGIDTKEILYGDSFKYDEWAAAKGLLEMPGRSHGYIKSFIKNPEFKFAQENIATHYITKMAEIESQLKSDKLTTEERNKLQDEYTKWDVTDPDVMERINKMSLEHGKWAILMNDNKFVDKFRRWADGEGIWGALIKSEVPIIKIPVNYVSRAFAYKYGLVRAIAGKGRWESSEKHFPGIIEIIKNGSKDITPQQADLLGKALTLGSMGASFFALGYTMRNKVKQNDDGSYDIFGVHVNKNLAHSPELESLFSGAETGNTFDKKKMSESHTKAWIESYVQGDIDIAKKSPFTSMLKYGFIPNLATAFLSKDETKIQSKVTDAVAKKLADMTIPGAVKQIAGGLDTGKPGLHILDKAKTRYPEGGDLERFWQTFELGIPGLRQNVPESKSATGTFKIYSGTKAREVTPEEYKKYETDREDIFKKKMRQIESRGTVWLNKFGEITIDEKKKRNTKPFNKLTPDERKEFESRIREQAGDEAKDKINF